MVREEWFKHLPEIFRAQAMYYAQREFTLKDSCGFEAVIQEAFDWCATTEGSDYWNDIDDRWIAGHFLPISSDNEQNPGENEQ